MEKKKYGAVVIGVSAGGIAALQQILPCLDMDFQIPICVVQHIGKTEENHLVSHFKEACALNVKEARDKEVMLPGTIYFAPPDYHLLIAGDKTLALSVDGKINFSRPSIDLLFETAAEAYCDELIGVILTGANSDGAHGLKVIGDNGGLTIVQSPETATFAVMPQAAITAAKVAHVLPLGGIALFLKTLEYAGTNESD
ncbi:MAG: chemotaxis protein CheB [Desulfotalea sp.]